MNCTSTAHATNGDGDDDDDIDTLACLRALDTEALTSASLAVYTDLSYLNSGTLWTAAVDGDYLPASPSALVAAGALAQNVTVVLGWMHDDLAAFTDTTVATPADVIAALTAWAPGLTNDTLAALLALYPADDFAADPAAGLAADFYRLAQIYRDAIMACQPLWFGAALAARGGDNSKSSVYLYEWNQTILDPIFAHLYGETGVGVMHESAFAYVLGNLSHYDREGWPFDPTASDRALARRAPRSWAAFAATGAFGGGGDDSEATFQGWAPAFAAGSNTTGAGSSGEDEDDDNDVQVFVVGGPEEGLSAIGGAGASPAVERQRLGERCAFLTSPAVREQLGY